MTELLEHAFAEAARLPEEEQNAIAGWLLDELRSEQQWAASFASSADTLRSLADEALAEDRQGATEPLDPERIG